MALPQNKDQLERTKFIEDTSGKVAVRTVLGDGNATIYAVVNTGAAGTQNSLVTLLAGPNQIGSVTISHPITATFGGNVTLNPGPSQIGSVTVSNPVQLAAGTSYIGLATAVVGNTVNALLQAGTSYIGLVSVQGNVNVQGLISLASGTEVRSLATILNFPATQAVSFNQLVSLASGTFVSLNAGTNAIGKLASNNGVDIGDVDVASIAAGDNNIGNVDIATLPALTTGANWIGLVTVNIGSANTVAASFSGNVTLNPSPNYIGLTTTVIGSAPTLYAVVNTSAPGVQESMVTLFPGPNQIGSVTVSNPVQLATGTNYIGLATVLIGAALPAGTNAIGKLASNSGVDIGDVDVLSIAAGNNNIGDVDVASIAAGDNNIGNVDIVTLPAISTGANWIGLATINIGSANTVAASFSGNVTLNPSPNFIGLATVNIGSSNATLFAVVNTSAPGVQQSMVTLFPGPNQIGSVTVSNPVQLAAGTNYIGLASVNIGGTLPALTVGAAYIGLATVIPAYVSTYTSFATIASAAGNVTIFVPPAGQRFIMKDLIIGSLGRNEVAILSGATILIPLIGLATTGGYISNFGDTGLRGKAADDSLVMNLNSAATVSIMTNVRFE